MKKNNNSNYSLCYWRGWGKKKYKKMNLKFTALEIGSGDAFLLEDGDRKILFDAGGSQDLIVRLLKKKKIKKIDLAICSHNDIDHANGFIGLLKTDIIIEEIWLPGLWADILQFVIDNRNNSHTIWFELDEYLCNNEAKNYSPEKQRYIPDNLYKSESVSVESFDDHLAIISELVDSGFLSFGEEVWDYLNHFARFYDYSCEFAINLKRIMKIAALAYGNGCKIRWFEPVDRCVVSPIDYSFVALNSKQVCKVKKLKNVACFMYALTLTKENQYSLVFEFFKNNAPVVRFSADSDVEYQSTSGRKTCKSTKNTKKEINDTAD